MSKRKRRERGKRKEGGKQKGKRKEGNSQGGMAVNLGGEEREEKTRSSKRGLVERSANEGREGKTVSVFLCATRREYIARWKGEGNTAREEINAVRENTNALTVDAMKSEWNNSKWI